MQDRSKVINKLALVLLSIVVLELVLIGDQVQPVKAIKKKIALKKLKKLLPLLALVKPKKKIIVVPIPFPMFKHHGGQNGQNSYQRPTLYPGQQHKQHSINQHQVNHNQMRPYSTNTMMLDGTGPPMSFVMMQQDPVGPLMVDSMQMMQMPTMNNIVPPMMLASPSGNTQPSAQMNSSGFGEEPTASTLNMLMPSMTMTLQTEPNGSSSSIELSTNMMPPPPPPPEGSAGPRNSSRLRAPPALSSASSMWRSQPEHQLFDEAPVAAADQQQQQYSAGGEQYYSSPWSAKSPLSSPAKVHRQKGTPHSGRLQQQQQQQQQQQPQSQPKAVIMIRNQWRPSLAQLQQHHHQQQLQQQHQQQMIQVPEMEALIPVGPAQMLPVYQTSNGQLHMSPPPLLHRPAAEPSHSNQVANNNNNNNIDSEVGLLTDGQQSHLQRGSKPAPARLTAASVKGKQQQSPPGSGGY